MALILAKAQEIEMVLEHYISYRLQKLDATYYHCLESQHKSRNLNTTNISHGNEKYNAAYTGNTNYLSW